MLDLAQSQLIEHNFSTHGSNIVQFTCKASKASIYEIPELGSQCHLKAKFSSRLTIICLERFTIKQHHNSREVCILVEDVMQIDDWSVSSGDKAYPFPSIYLNHSTLYARCSVCTKATRRNITSSNSPAYLQSIS